ncbi:MAG: aromatic-ring-hydroxylating dioxygenase subunit beta [Steroidobacteraceae bacterium]
MSDTKRPSDAELIAFVYQEARLIDEKRLEEWYELFTEDARYWMPLTRGQPDAATFTSLFYEDKLLLRLRIERLRSSNAFSQQQPSFCQHVLQQPSVEQADPVANQYLIRTPFVYVESRLDSQFLLAGVVHHHLCLLDGRLRIRLKKVELVNCDAALPSVELFP